jgi:hypothetical protein
MNLLNLAQRLQDNRIGSLSKNIFIQMLPANAEQGILLRSPLAGTKIDYYLPGFYRSSFQLIVRGNDYVALDALTKSAIAALTFDETLLGTQDFYFCRPTSLPVVYPLTKGNLIETNVGFECVFTE